jgi:hypothetical protein
VADEPAKPSTPSRVLLYPTLPYLLFFTPSTSSSFSLLLKLGVGKTMDGVDVEGGSALRG